MASNLTTRCSGRTRASRPVQSTGRATRRAAERARWAYMTKSLLPIALLLVVGVTHADALRLENGRYPGPVMTFNLTEAQKKVLDRYRDCQVEHPNTMNVYTPFIFRLTASQAKALVAKKGFSPRVFAVYETYREFNDVDRHSNLMLRFSEEEFEVPLDLVVPSSAARAVDEAHGRDAFNPCFPELLAP